MSHDSALLSAQVNKLNIKDDDVGLASLIRRSGDRHLPFDKLLTLLQSTETSPSELVAVVDDMLNQLSTKFGSISSELIAKSTFTYFILRSQTLRRSSVVSELSAQIRLCDAKPC